VQRAFDLVHGARFSPAIRWDAACAQVQRAHGVDLSRARVRCGFARGHLLDIVVYVPGGLGHAQEQEAAEELAWLVLGGELFERWVRQVSVAPTVRGGPLNVLNTNRDERGALPVRELEATVSSAVRGLLRGLAEAPFAPTKTEEWVLFELEPTPATDYAGQDDLLIASTRLPELKKSFLRGEPFFSGRFSTCGELFAYLKYESAALTSEARLAERGELESALVRNVGPEQATIFGAGLGLRYAYLDLALREPSAVERLILPTVRAAPGITRGWLLFCDAELEREWVGIYADTPEPFWG